LSASAEQQLGTARDSRERSAEEPAAGHKLQSFLLKARPDAEELYWRRTETQESLGFDLLTWFNMLPIATWRDLGGVRYVAADLLLKGKGRVHLVHFSAAGLRSCVAARSFAFVAPGSLCFDNIDLSVFADGVLGLVIAFDGPGELVGGAWLTPEAPRHTVRLAVVITSFHREAAVRDTIHKLVTALPPRTLDRIIVVDNGRTLSQADVPGAKLLLRPNLGGAGGFSCGLSEAMRSGATHCLFMDDDADCEPETILRTIRLFARAHPRLAVAGALLLEDDPCRQWDAGSNLGVRGVAPRAHMVNLADPVATLRGAEAPDPQYGSWFYFAFPLQDVSRLAYPFFVKGDDLEFSLAHGWRIVSPLGIGVWSTDPRERDGAFSPLNTYLAVRAQLVTYLLHRTPADAAYYMTSCLRFCLGRLLLRDYATVRMVSLAFRHVALGPSIFRDHPDCAAGRMQVTAELGPQVLRSYPIGPSPTDNRASEKGLLQRFLCALTLAGHLMPYWARSDEPEIVGYRSKICLRHVWRKREVLMQLPNRSVFLVQTISLRRFLGEAARLLVISVRLRWRLITLAADYQKDLPSMTSESYWLQAVAKARQASASEQT